MPMFPVFPLSNSRSAVAHQHRFQSSTPLFLVRCLDCAIRTWRNTSTASPSHIPFPPYDFRHQTKNHGSFKKNWLSDPSTYPVLFCLGAACALCTGVGIACLSSNPDVRINPGKRSSILRADDMWIPVSTKRSLFHIWIIYQMTCI